MVARQAILALNAGSSSLKATLFHHSQGALQAAASATVERVGRPGATLSASGQGASPVSAPDHGAAFAAVLAALTGGGGGGAGAATITAVGHRIVHGGLRTEPAPWSAGVAADVQAATPLAPLHNPAALATAAAARAALPAALHVAVFDTAFHVASLPPAAFTYPLPPSLSAPGALGLGAPPARRYGFHGISCAAAVPIAAGALGVPATSLSSIIAHLGAGASITATARGRSVHTSMGATPLEGLAMATRCGDLDPALPGLWLGAGVGVVPPGQLQGGDGGGGGGVARAALSELLTTQSGLAGLSGLPGGDMRDVLAALDAGDAAATLAFSVWNHRARCHLGAALAAATAAAGALPSALIFTGGIGERSPRVRAALLDGLAPLGLGPLDPGANGACAGLAPGAVVRVDDGRGHTSRVAVLVVGADEERAIAQAALDASPGR